MLRTRTFFLLAASLSLLLAGCQPGSMPGPAPTAGQTLLPENAPEATETPIPPPTPTAPPPRSLVICLGQEPSSLYLYGSGSGSTWSVLEAIYDGPFDLRDYETAPVILQKMPAFADGDAAYQAVSVQNGDQVVDVNGDLVTLQAGVQVQPSGCSTGDCTLTWDGVSPLQMDQTVVTFQLLPGITWSDGAPLTAQDSVYSFRVAADRGTPVSKQVIHRTTQYQALDEARVQWTGVPGYFPERFDTLFWTPLPEHAWGNVLPEDLLLSEISTRFPIGWGPYVIDEWVEGDHIRLHRNPTYFRAAEGLPRFDVLVYRFLDRPGDSLLEALQSRECDVIDQSTALEDQLAQIRELQASGELQALVGLGPEWEQMVFGIRPAAYDDGYAPYYGDRPDFFRDVRTRQAIAYCIDRQGIVDSHLNGWSAVPPAYLPPTHPLYLNDLPPYPFDTARGRQLLNEAGWKDWDGNPETPLQAVGIPEIADGTFFRIRYVTTTAGLRVQVAEQVRESLAACGIEVEVQPLSPEELYAPGPDGVIFGRTFDLAAFSWKSGLIPPCQFYVSSQVPATENNWLLLNVGGYANPAFDAACQGSLTVRPDQGQAYSDRQQEVQRLFATELPVLPLYYRLRITLTQPDICGIDPDPSARSVLWNIEAVDSGDGCGAQ